MLWVERGRARHNDRRTFYDRSLDGTLPLLTGSKFGDVDPGIKTTIPECGSQLLRKLLVEPSIAEKWAMAQIPRLIGHVGSLTRQG